MRSARSASIDRGSGPGVRAPDGRYHAVCLTVLSLDADGRIVELTTFVLPELFAAWGFPAVLDV